MNKQKLIERLADKEHESWARWMTYLFGKCERQADGSMLIPAELVAHWQQEVETSYADLPERYQQSDRDEVAHILPIIDAFVLEREEQIEPLRQLVRDFEAWATGIAPHSFAEGRAARAIRERVQQMVEGERGDA